MNNVYSSLIDVATVAKSYITFPKIETPHILYVAPPSFRGVLVETVDIFSTIHPNHLIVGLTLVVAFFVLYIKIKYPFWNQVPALHTYDWHRRYLYSEKPYRIRLLPRKTKYLNPECVDTYFYRNLDDVVLTEITQLLQNNYIPSDRLFCSIQLADFAAHFSGHSNPPIVSLYNETVITTISNVENIDVIETEKKKNIQGVITSRPITISIVNQKGTEILAQEPAYYMDFLCFNKHAVSPLKVRQLFQTHEFNQSHYNLSVNISIFKKEVELCPGLVPLVEYNTYTFYMRYKVETPLMPKNFQIVRIQREHKHHLYDFVERIGTLREGTADLGFRLSIVADIGSIITLLQTNQMFAYAFRGPDKDTPGKFDSVYSIYFFRNAHTKYDELDGGDTLQFVAGFCNTNDAELYFVGFLWSLKEVVKDFGSKIAMLSMDDVGHVRPIIARWLSKNDSIFTTKSAYYSYNYIIPKTPIDPGAFLGLV